MTTAQIDQEELIQFLYQCPVGIAQIDPGGAVLLLNAKGSQLLMPHAGSAGLDNLFDVVDRHDPALRNLCADSRAGYGTVCEHRVVRLESPAGRPGGDQHLAFTLLRLGADSIMAVFEDVTRVVAAEAEARDLLTSSAIERGRSELAAEVLHDVGNAVVGIGTRTAALLEEAQWPELVQLERLGEFLSSRREVFVEALGAKKAEALPRLVGEIHQALESRRRRSEESMQSFRTSVHHIQEILSLHRHYARQSARGGRERVSIRVVVEDALTIQASGFEKRGVAIVRRSAPDLPKLSLDRTRMIQVVGNLLRNAGEAFDAQPAAAGRAIVVEAEPLPGGGGIRLEIRDNACGFAPERAESLFQKHSTTKSRGSGIGLHNCRKVVEAHGGTLVLTSEGPGAGASAVLTLPQTPPAEPTHADGA